MKLPICDCIHTANSPEYIRAKNEEYRKNYEKALAECEQSCRVPIIVDQDFQYLYRGLRIDPDLVKRVSKGKASPHLQATHQEGVDNVEPEQEDLAGTPS